MANYLELAQLPDGTIVLRRSDDHKNPIVKIEKKTKNSLANAYLNHKKQDKTNKHIKKQDIHICI